MATRFLAGKGHAARSMDARPAEAAASAVRTRMTARWLTSRVKSCGALMCATLLSGVAACGRPEGTVQLPEQASTHAAEVDWLYYFLFWVSVVSFVLITITTVWFSWKFRRRPGHKARPPGHHTALELFWTFSPLVVLAFMFHWGFQGYVAGAVAPSGAEQIRVYGQQWSWTYVYPNGGTAPGHQLVVPVAEPVKLTMTSKDVIHSFFIPDFRMKRDTVPGLFTSIWFEADRPTQSVAKNGQGEPLACDPNTNACPEGFACRYDLDPALKERKAYCFEAHQVFCTEYCGAPSGDGNKGHSAMYGNVHVVSRGEYETFLDLLLGPPQECATVPEDEVAVCWGGSLFAQNNCAGQCHNGQAAPNLSGLWGRTEQLTDGTVTLAGDAGEAYLRESILAPNAKRVAGYAAQMPQYGFNDAQVDALVAFLKQYSESN